MLKAPDKGWTAREVSIPAVSLTPDETLALNVGLAQVLRGEYPMSNVATVCVLALARVTGKHDWTNEGPS